MQSVQRLRQAEFTATIKGNHQLRAASDQQQIAAIQHQHGVLPIEAGPRAGLLTRIGTGYQTQPHLAVYGDGFDAECTIP